MIAAIAQLAQFAVLVAVDGLGVVPNHSAEPSPPISVNPRNEQATTVGDLSGRRPEAGKAGKEGSRSPAASIYTQIAGPRVPFNALAGPHADRTRTILRQPVVKRIRSAEVFPCDPVLLEWLFAHPAWAAELWRTMGVPISPLTKIGDGYECHEDSAMARIHVVHAEPGLRVVYCLGEARKPPLPGKLRAEMVVVQRYAFSKQTDGQYYIVQQLEAYAYAEGTALKSIMKLTRPACEQLVDRCLQDLTIYFTLLARIVQMEPKAALANIARIRTPMAEPEATELTAIVSRNQHRVLPTGTAAARTVVPKTEPTAVSEPQGLPTAPAASPFVSSWTLGPDKPVTDRQPNFPAADRTSRPAPIIRR